jgi:hypothetical protein
MKNSITRMGTSNAVLRLIRLVLPAILAGGTVISCGPLAMQAQQAPKSSPVGQWRTVLQGVPLTISIQANGQYMQQGDPPNGGTKTMQAGPYQLVAPNTIVFTVTDWSPKIKVMFIPDPGPVPSVPNPVGPYPGPNGPQYQTYAIPHPPGSRYTYVFNGPNSMTLKNVTSPETITFTRVAGQ